MKDFIGCLLFFALFMLGLYYQHKDKKRKEYEEWRYYCQRRLHSLALRFRDECMVEAKAVITRYTNFIKLRSYHNDRSSDLIAEYEKSIDNLKKEYLCNYATKNSDGNNRMRIEAEELPKYMLEEYEAEISEITNTFRDIGYHMWEQIQELKENYNKL